MTNGDQTNMDGLPRHHIFHKALESVEHALANSGIYELVDRFAKPPVRKPPAFPFLPEQHILQDLKIIMEEGFGTSSSTGTIAVVVPPLHHQIVTAKLNVAPTAKTLKEAQDQLESAIESLEQVYQPTPAGLGITVAWGLPYFQNYIPRLSKSSPHFSAGMSYPDYLPIDNRASQAAGQTVRAILDAITFPSDQPPPGFPSVLLEENDVAVLSVTSIRRGFAGGGFYGGQSLLCQMARAANIPAAEHIPLNAELFMGFTSSHAAALGPTLICNMESLPGLTDQWPNGYFQHGTTMHLSHLFEDLQGWYEGHEVANFSRFSDRLRAAFRPGLDFPEGTQTVAEGMMQVESEEVVAADLSTHGAVGHSAAIQPVTRLQQDVIDNYGNFYPAGTSIPQRADFNTLDNPFYYSANPSLDRYANSPAAGLHFLVFAPTSDAFHRGRLAMDGHYPSGRVLNLHPRAFEMGFNAVLFTTHRQNVLVPPRAHRSFPLAEYLV